MVKNPFKKNDIKTKSSKSKKPRKEQIFIEEQQIEVVSVEDVSKISDSDSQPVGDVPFAESKSTTQVSNFFCTSDAFFDTMDDYEMYKSLSV